MSGEQRFLALAARPWVTHDYLLEVQVAREITYIDPVDLLRGRRMKTALLTGISRRKNATVVLNAYTHSSL
jgi:hypothetical protein